MAIEVQEDGQKKNYFGYVFLSVILIAVFYFLITQIFKKNESAAPLTVQEDIISATTTDINDSILALKKDKVTELFESPDFKALVKYQPLTVGISELGRPNPFVLFPTSTLLIASSSPSLIASSTSNPASQSSKK